MKRIAVDSYLVEERVGDLGKFEKTRTQQNFAEEVDINNIVDRALKTGYLGDEAALNARRAIFADVSSLGDYNGMLNKIISAQNAFLELPVDIRAKFDNDPGKMLAFMRDAANYDECVKIGLFEPKKSPVVHVNSQGEVVPPPGEKSAAPTT